MFDIENNSVLLVSNKEKKKVLKSLNDKLLNVKIMSIEEFIKRYTFNYDDKTIYNLMKHYNIK